MPWHLSRSDPRKVYDERHFTVCVCQNPDQSTLIVRAVNHLRNEAPVLELREPQIGMTVGMKVPDLFIAPLTIDAPLDTFEPDRCCSVPLIKAGRDGVLKALSSWTCPKCGTEWKPQQSAAPELRHWEPVSDVQIMRGPR